ncbi:hypothetical protein PoB_005621100 [Plakobranchus ocellatus]|uniref:Uncharacterized protein n=1 Tax=Plakobranchus ocellatus TaxID=259542 RepID=A0AAV4CAG3_9GAST|nr:hypothetical protein PoB_005621100 [Plakobranchus ocellatus]
MSPKRRRMRSSSRRRISPKRRRISSSRRRRMSPKKRRMRISRRRMSSRSRRMRSRRWRGRKETLMMLVLRICNLNYWDTVPVAEELKQTGVRVLAVGVALTDDSEIKVIALSPKDIYWVKSETLVVLLSLLAILLHQIISVDGAPVAQWIANRP